MSEARSIPYYEDEMRCAACDQPLTRWDRNFAHVWIDPGGQSCIAHDRCLRQMGEWDLNLPPVA